MPPAMRYDPNSPTVRDLSARELRERRSAFNKSHNYYLGIQRRQLKTVDGEPDDNVVINLVMQVVDRMVAFLFPKMPTFELEPNDPVEEALLAALWREAGGVAQLHKLGKLGSLGGHVYARIVQDGERLRVLALSPANIVTFWKADDYEQVLWHELHTVDESGNTLMRQDVVWEDGGWQIIEYEKSGLAQGFREVRRVSWAASVPPVVSWPHLVNPGMYYGLSDVGKPEDNDAPNKIASDATRILRYHASPRTVGTGFTAEDVTMTGIDHFWTVANDKAEIKNLEMQSDLNASREMVKMLMDAFYRQRRIVIMTGEVADFQRVTTLGLQAIYNDMLGKLEELRRNYEPGLIALSYGLLEALGRPRPERIEVHWPDPLPQDPLATVQRLQMLQQMGVVSQESIQRTLGIDPEVERTRMESDLDREAEVTTRQEMQAME